MWERFFDEYYVRSATGLRRGCSPEVPERDPRPAKIDFDDLQSEREFVPFEVYGQAKLAMLLTTYALVRRLAGTGVTANALHPGITATNIVKDVEPPLARPFLGLLKPFLPTPE